MKVKLQLIARDKNGKIIKRLCKERDMITAQFRKLFLFGVIGRANTTASEVTILLKTEAGETSYVPVWWSSPPSVFYGTDMTGRKIAIGEGIVAVARDDYALGSKSYETEAVDVVESENHVIFYTTIPCPEAKSISEAGYFGCYYGKVNTTYARRWYLLLRDTFPAIEVVAGGALSIVYTVEI